MNHRLSCSISILLFFFGYAFFSSSALEITTPSTLPDAVKDEFYSFQLEAEGAVGDVTWEIETGEMEYVEIETPHHFAGTPYAVQVVDELGRIISPDPQNPEPKISTQSWWSERGI